MTVRGVSCPHTKPWAHGTARDMGPRCLACFACVLFFLSSATISTAAPSLVNSSSPRAGRGCLERLQAAKLPRNRIPPQHIIINSLEAKQLSQLFPPPSFSCFVRTQAFRWSTAPRSAPASCRRPRLLSALRKTRSH